MEERRIRPLLVVFVVVGAARKAIHDLFLGCYNFCFRTCLPFEGAIAKCLVECLRRVHLSFSRRHPCDMNCALSSCSKIGTKNDPQE
ncbi:unnamed protein product [Dovyalis caffra]|uniref:Secreted protein n=1 Tax=Dovyalis caffra TaxID=77055 RepID=A0AAV1ST13_9ROSI|nr:unnamed protein product [Dovyalis caffra]